MRFVENPGWHDLVDAYKADILQRVGESIRDDAAILAPKRTGAMASSGVVHVNGSESADIEFDKPALWIEEGHRIVYRDREGNLVDTGRFQEPQPFMRPALYKDRTDEL